MMTNRRLCCESFMDERHRDNCPTVDPSGQVVHDRRDCPVMKGGDVVVDSGTIGCGHCLEARGITVTLSRQEWIAVISLLKFNRDWSQARRIEEQLPEIGERP